MFSVIFEIFPCFFSFKAWVSVFDRNQLKLINCFLSILVSFKITIVFDRLFLEEKEIWVAEKVVWIRNRKLLYFKCCRIDVKNRGNWSESNRLSFWALESVSLAKITGVWTESNRQFSRTLNLHFSRIKRTIFLNSNLTGFLFELRAGESNRWSISFLTFRLFSLRKDLRFVLLRWRNRRESEFARREVR